MEEKLNEIKLKIAQSTYNLPHDFFEQYPDFKGGMDYYISMMVSITHTNEHEYLDDGTYNLKMKAKPTGMICISDKHKHKTYLKASKTKSQLLRFRIQEKNPSSDMPDDIFYNMIMDKLINNLDAILNFVRSK